MNKFKYAFVNSDRGVIAMVYEDDKYGRTIVVLKKIDANYPIELFDREGNKISEDKEISLFLFNMLPV